MVDDARLGRRPRDDADRWRAGSDEHREALEPVPSEPEPETDARRGHDDARPRVREHERNAGDVEQDDTGRAQEPRMAAARRQPETEWERERGHEREGVPVADRVAEPRDTRAVGEQPREHLPEERPAEHAEAEPRQHARRPGRRPAHERRDEEPEDDEGEVRKAAVQVGPRAVGRDRPRDRQSAPQDERREQAEGPPRSFRK